MVGVDLQMLLGGGVFVGLRVAGVIVIFPVVGQGVPENLSYGF